MGDGFTQEGCIHATASNLMEVANRPRLILRYLQHALGKRLRTFAKKGRKTPSTLERRRKEENHHQAVRGRLNTRGARAAGRARNAASKARPLRAYQDFAQETPGGITAVASLKNTNRNLRMDGCGSCNIFTCCLRIHWSLSSCRQETKRTL